MASKKAWRTPDIRKKYVDSLCQTRWIKVRTDKGQLAFIDKWNRLGFNFEPNYQLKIGNDLFYLDGYDSIHNIVLEYDSEYHGRFSQKVKDLERQQKILNHLKPQRFWRYFSKTSLFIECMSNTILNRG